MPVPIKRSPQLAPLSRDHHEGLLAVWKIRQGLKNSASLNVMAQFVAWFWEQHLQLHFKKEENLLTPYLPAGDVMVARLFSDHEAIEALINVIAMIPDEATFIQLANAVETHIRFEERELFPFAEKVIPIENLLSLQPLLEEKPPAKGWDNDFWLRSTT